MDFRPGEFPPLHGFLSLFKVLSHQGLSFFLLKVFYDLFDFFSLGIIGVTLQVLKIKVQRFSLLEGHLFRAQGGQLSHSCIRRGRGVRTRENVYEIHRLEELIDEKSPLVGLASSEQLTCVGELIVAYP